MTLEEEAAVLRSENEDLRGEVARLLDELATALELVAELKQGKKRPP